MLNKLSQWIDAFFDKLAELAMWILDGGLSGIGELIFFIWDKFLLIIETLFSAIDTSLVDTAFDRWAGLPEPVLYVLGQLDLGGMLLALSAAYGIRFLINLIPSWATRA